MKKTFKIFLAAVGLLMATSCELDLLDNPNEVSTEQGDPDFVLNSVQLNFADFFVAMSQFGMDNTRMLAMFGNNYPNAYQATTFDGVWTTAYANILNDVQYLEQVQEERGTFEYHAAMAKVFRAYTLMSMVDYFGDVPFTETLDPNNFNPKADPASGVYQAAFNDLSDAIELIENADETTVVPETDLYYEFEDEVGDWSVKWLKLAKTLQLRYHLQTRLINAAASTTAINNLIAEGNLIDSDDEAFLFNYSSASIAAPDSRHPWFSANYVNGAGQYMSNSYINHMFVGKAGTRDPRIRHYFYRQTLAIPTDVNVLDCIEQTKPAHYGANDVFCFVGAGYWGRDHLDDDGIPPDNLLRTIYGLYPAGGQWDDSQGERGTQDSGAKGSGMLPIMLPSFVLFMRAEAALTLGTTGVPRTLFEQAVRSSIGFVRSYNTDFIPLTSTRFPSTTAVNAFVTGVMSDYDAQTTDAGRLNAIVTEYWIALWGNGVDMYNTYRRTGMPTTLQPALNATPGAFYRSFTYPSVYVNRNNTAVQKTTPAVKVFWDNNPDGFID